MVSVSGLYADPDALNKQLILIVLMFSRLADAFMKNDLLNSVDILGLITLSEKQFPAFLFGIRTQRNTLSKIV